MKTQKGIHEAMAALDRANSRLDPAPFVPPHRARRIETAAKATHEVWKRRSAEKAKMQAVARQLANEENEAWLKTCLDKATGS